MDGKAEVILDVCTWDTEELSTVPTDILSVSLATESAGKEGVELKGGVWEDPIEEDMQVPRTDVVTQFADMKWMVQVPV